MLVKIIRGEQYSKKDAEWEAIIHKNKDMRKEMDEEVDSDAEIEEYEYDYDYNYDGEPVDEEMNTWTMGILDRLLNDDDNIIYLDCSDNKISNLDVELPPSLLHFHCEYNWLRELPELPNRLKILDCSYHANLLRQLPSTLPDLKEFYCSDNLQRCKRNSVAYKFNYFRLF